MNQNPIDDFTKIQALQFGLSIFLFLIVVFAYFLLLKNKEKTN